MAAIALANKTIRLEGVVYISNCNIDFISLEQLCKNNIMSIDNKDNMTLIYLREKRDSSSKKRP